MDFKQIVDRIFINRDKYWEISDEDKEKNFFIINRKFARKYPQIAQFFNFKSVNKSDAMDRWYFVFENSNRIPFWYWGNKSKKEKKKYLPESDVEMLRVRLDLKESDIKFLYEYYNSELNDYIKKIKSY
jgi:hypothetical protein